MVELLTFAPLAAIALAAVALMLGLALLMSPAEGAPVANGVFGYLSLRVSRLLASPHFRRGLLSGLAVGAAVGVAAVWIAWQHNPQDAIHSEVGAAWGYLVLIWMGWCGIGAAVVGPPVWGLSHLVSRARRPAV